MFDSVWGVIPPPERNTAWNKGRKYFHCLGAPNNLIRPCPDACWRSSESSVGSAVLPLAFSDASNVYKHLSNRILQKFSFHDEAISIEIKNICAIDSKSQHNVIQNILSQILITGSRILTLLRAWRHCPVKQVSKAQWSTDIDRCLLTTQTIYVSRTTFTKKKPQDFFISCTPPTDWFP